MTDSAIRIRSLAQLSGGQDWRLTLAHDRPEHLLFWITRGQGRLLLNGQRRGTGTHNAVFVPARSLFALDVGRQGGGLVVSFQDGTDLRLPDTPRQLRIRDIQSQAELMALIETAQREQQAARPLFHEAMEAFGTLISVWLRRQMAQDEHVPPADNAAQRLSARYCKLISRDFTLSVTMAEHAEALSVTPTHLSRACKVATGKTAADLMTERVLWEARHLLATTKVPAQDIARHLGFGSAAYFTRFVQQHTKMSPIALRKAARRAASTPERRAP